MPIRAAAAVFALLALATPLAADDVADRTRTDAQKHYEKGQSLMRAESFEEAVAEFKASITLDPSFVLAYYSLGQANMPLKRYADAITAYEACRQAIIDQGQLGLKERATAERRREDELRGLKDALQFAQAGKDKSASAGTILRMEERVRFLENSRMTGDKNRTTIPGELLLALGSAYFRAGKLEDAEREYVAAIKTDNHLGSAHNNLAVVYMMTGRLKEAEESVRLAEKAGFPVHPQLKADIKKRQGQ